MAMTLQEAKSIARHLGLTLRKVRSGDYRVNFRDGNETTAYYTDSLEDAVDTAVEMARKRALELRHTEPGRDSASPQPFQSKQCAGSKGERAPRKDGQCPDLWRNGLNRRRRLR